MDLFYGVLLSAHLGLTGDYNSIHPYAGTYLNNNFMAGAYYNSEYNVSTYIGYTKFFKNNTSLELGLVTGYSHAQLTPMMKLNYDRFFISPALENKDTVGIIIGSDWRF